MTVEEWGDLFERAGELWQELVTQEEYVAALGDDLPEDSEAIEMELLDAQAYMNNAIDSLGSAISLIEDKMPVWP